FPPSLQIVRSAVVVFQVIGVFPDVIEEKRFDAVIERRVLVSPRRDFQSIAFDGNDGPPGTELSGAGFVERRAEIFERAVVAFNDFAELAVRFGLMFRTHRLPEKRMVIMAAAVVLDARSRRFRKRIYRRKKFAERFIVDRRMRFDG